MKISAETARLAAEQKLRQMNSMDEWTAVLRILSRFHGYSLNNILLIAMQDPEAVFLAGFTEWSERYGRRVRRGESGIRILKPVRRKIMMYSEEDPGHFVQESSVTGYRISAVFDVRQTAGEPLSERMRSRISREPLPAERLLQKLILISPADVQFRECADERAFCDMHEKRIVIPEDMTDEEKCVCLCRMICRIFLQECEEQYRSAAEECACFTVLTHEGMNREDMLRETESLMKADCDTVRRVLLQIRTAVHAACRLLDLAE